MMMTMMMTDDDDYYYIRELYITTATSHIKVSKIVKIIFACPSSLSSSFRSRSNKSVPIAGPVAPKGQV